MPVLGPAHTSFPNYSAQASGITDTHACPLNRTQLAVHFGFSNPAMTIEPRWYSEHDPDRDEHYVRLATEGTLRFYTEELSRWKEAAEELARDCMKACRTHQGGRIDESGERVDSG